MLLGAEFIAMLMIIVYVGAVAVLFLFVVMMLDIDFANLRKGAMQYVPFGVVIGGILLAEFAIIFSAWKFAGSAPQNLDAPTPAADSGITNTEALGQILYTDYVLVFQGAGMILFVAMIGAIVLTLRTRPGVRRQKVADQYARRAENVLSVEKVTPNTGV